MNNDTKFDELPPEILTHIISFLGILECYQFLFVNKLLHTITKPQFDFQVKHKIQQFFYDITTKKDGALEKEVIENKFRCTTQIRTFESQGFSMLINAIEKQIFFHKCKNNNQHNRPRINSVVPLDEIVEELDNSIAESLSEVLFHQQEVNHKNASCESVIKLRLQSPLITKCDNFVDYNEYDEIESDGEYEDIKSDGECGEINGDFDENFTLNKRDRQNDSGDEQEEEQETEKETDVTFYFTYGFGEHTRYNIYEQHLSFAISSNSKRLIDYLSNPAINICSIDSRESVSAPVNDQEMKLALGERQFYNIPVRDKEIFYSPDIDSKSTVISLYSIDDIEDTEAIFNPLVARKFIMLLLNNRLKHNSDYSESFITKISGLMKLISNNTINTKQIYKILFNLNCTKYKGELLITPLETITKNTLPNITFDFDCGHINPFNYFFQWEPIFLKKLIDKHFDDLFISNQLLSHSFWKLVKKILWNYQLTQIENYLQKNLNWLIFTSRIQPMDVINMEYVDYKYNRDYQYRNVVPNNPLFHERIFSNMFNLKAKSIEFELKESLTDCCYGCFSLYIPPIHKDQMKYITFNLLRESQRIYDGDLECNLKVTAKSNFELPLSRKIFDKTSRTFFLIGSKSKAYTYQSNAATRFSCGMLYHNNDKPTSKHLFVLFDFLMEEFGLPSFEMEYYLKGYYTLQFIEFVISFLAHSQQSKRGRE